MKRTVLVAAFVGLLPLSAFAEAPSDAILERGRYVAVVGGCNDCHTGGYAQSGGQTPQAEWLKGSPVGYRGPWGTVYATNLRAYFADRTEDDWVRAARTLEARPPMPWFNVRAMTETDQRALYHFVRSLGPAGALTPEAVPPGEEPKTPYVVMAPPTMPR